MTDTVFLEKQRERLAYRIAHYREPMKNIRPGEEIDARAAFKFNVLIPRVLIALQKIDDGSYGICEDCEEHIPLKRLEAVPGALCCVPCQERRDTRHG
jgi:RNA polymerase-binding transcription factor DksA